MSRKSKRQKQQQRGKHKHVKGKREPLVLYDSHGRPIPPSVPSETAGLPKGTLPTTQSVSPPKSQDNKKGFWPQFLKGKALAIEVVAIVASIVTIYAIRPVLSVTSVTSSDMHGQSAVKATIMDNGIGISDVMVQCITNKVIFEERFTLDLSNYTKINEYSVPGMQSGESFTVECPFMWSMYATKVDGFFSFGDAIPGQKVLAIPFKVSNGIMSVPASGAGAIGVTPSLSVSTPGTKQTTTRADGTMVIRYKWSLCPWFSQEKRFHFITVPYSGGITWKEAPRSEPTISDARLPGYKLKASGGVILQKAKE